MRGGMEDSAYLPSNMQCFEQQVCLGGTEPHFTASGILEFIHDDTEAVEVGMTADSHSNIETITQFRKVS